MCVFPFSDASMIKNRTGKCVLKCISETDFFLLSPTSPCFMNISPMKDTFPLMPLLFFYSSHPFFLPLSRLPIGLPHALPP